MSKIVPRSFFDRPGKEVARDILGQFLVRRVGEKTLRVPITEVEVYEGHDDDSSHAARGKTKRNYVMWGPAGHFYVYLCYGMYHMLNIVTGPDDFPAALLIRGAGEWGGPGKLTRALKIGAAENGKPASRATGLWFEEGEKVPPARIERLPRVGLNCSSRWKEKKLRFRIRKNK